MLFPMEGAITLFAASSLARLRTVVSLICSITYHIPMIWILPFLDGLVSLLYHHRQENEHLPIRMYVCILGMAVSVRLRAIQYLFRGWHRFRIITQTYRKPKNRMPPCFIKRKTSAKRTQAECEAAHHSTPSHANGRVKQPHSSFRLIARRIALRTRKKPAETILRASVCVG